MNYPIVLQGSIASLGPNQIRGLDRERALKNITSRILRVRELRFRVEQAGHPGATIGSDFGDVEVQLRIGNEPVTAGLVPLSAMVWPADISQFLESIGPHQPYLIRFSRPILLPPGGEIMAQFRHANISGSGSSIFVQVYAVCEDAANAGSSFTPWFAFYRTPVHLDGSGVFEDTSTEADLLNPFRQELHVERAISHTFINYEVANVFPMTFDAVRVRMEDNDAVQIIRDATPISLVFDTIFRSWEFNSPLVSKGFYRVSVESRLLPQVISGTPLNVYSVIGIFGYRPVR